MTKQTKQHPSVSGGKWCRPDKRLSIYLRDGLACCWCGFALEEGEALTLDHVIPHSHGGSNEAENLITACRRCNSSRGNRSITEFARAVAKYRGNTTTRKITDYIRKQLKQSITTYRAEAKLIIARRREQPEE